MLNRRAVPSNTIGPRFESSHRQSFVMNIFTVNYQKDKIRKKMAGNGPFFYKKNLFAVTDVEYLLLTIEKRKRGRECLQ